MPSSVSAGRLQGAEGSRASCWETLTPARMGAAGLAAPLPAWAGSDPRLCARSIPARQLPAPRGPDCRAPRRGARHCFTPTCALHSLTAPEPMEMHQKLLSNELILVQSCYQSFCCSACHNLSCLVQPCPPPSPGCPTSPAMPLPSSPTGSPCGCRGPLLPQPQVRSVRTLQLAVVEALKASSNAGLSVQGLVLPGPSACAGSVGFGGILCAVPSSSRTRAMWLLTRRVQEEGPTPRRPAAPEDGAGGLVLVLQGPLLGEALPTQLSCSPRPLPALPALLVFCGFLACPWLSTWAVTPPGMCRGTLSEVRKKRAGLPPHRDGARGGSSVGNKSELPCPFSGNGAARF